MMVLAFNYLMINALPADSLMLRPASSIRGSGFAVWFSTKQVGYSLLSADFIVGKPRRFSLYMSYNRLYYSRLELYRDEKALSVEPGEYALATGLAFGLFRVYVSPFVLFYSFWADSSVNTIDFNLSILYRAPGISLSAVFYTPASFPSTSIFFSGKIGRKRMGLAVNSLTHIESGLVWADFGGWFGFLLKGWFVRFSARYFMFSSKVFGISVKTQRVFKKNWKFFWEFDYVYGTMGSEFTFGAGAGL